ncbi:MAG: Flp family type IVb pilin [Gaiellaceae bacterium]
MPHLTYRIRLLADETGQTMAEYGVVLALVTLAVLAALTMLGGNVSNALTSVANHLP